MIEFEFEIDRAVMLYKSPIQIVQEQISSIESQLENQLENETLKAIHKYGIYVDKDELIKALKYDRQQYDKGFEDGVHKCRQELLEILRENDCYISTAVINKLLTIGS